MFYKIFNPQNPEEHTPCIIHNNGLVEMQYPILFNEAADINEATGIVYENYGLHFSDTADILAWLEYGSHIAVVTVPDGSKIEDLSYYEYPMDYITGTITPIFPHVYIADKIILSNIRPVWDIQTLKQLKAEGVDIHYNEDLLLAYAVKQGHYDITVWLLENGADPRCHDDICVELAKDPKIKALFLEYFSGSKYKPSANDNPEYLGRIKKILE